LNRNLATIGDSRISVPEYFYKVLATQDGKTAIAFLMPTDATTDYRRYEMSVESLERITGLDFLHGMNGEKNLESSFDASAWKLDAKFQYAPCRKPLSLPFAELMIPQAL
jgi:endonuclease G